jgi:hypothetical protein
MRVYRQLTTERLMVATLFMLLFAMAVRVPTDTDTWWHLRSGETMAEQRAILRHDLFSHTRLDAGWINHSWGAQLVLVGAYELFGGGVSPGDPGNIGLALFTALLATAGMALVYAMCEGNAYARAFAVVLGGAAAAVFWSPRPQMFSFALGAAVLYLLHLYKRRQIDRLWLIPLLIVLWVNLHGGFAIAFILLLGTIAGEVLGNLLGDTRPSVVRGARLGKLVGVTAVSVPLVALNPYGLRMLAYPFDTVGIGALQDFIQEWATPDFHEAQTWPFLLLLLGIIAAFGISGRRADWTDLTLVAGTAAMALLAGRNIALFALVATPVLTRHLDAWLTERGWQVRPRRRIGGRMLVVNWVLLGVIVAGAMVKASAALGRETMREAQAELFPVELAAYLEQTRPAGNLFNSYNWGGYLIFAAPQVPVYVDGRTDLYNDEFLRQYLDVLLLRHEWEASLERQEIDLVAIEAQSALAGALRLRADRWREQRFDGGRSALFVRLPAGA